MGTSAALESYSVDIVLIIIGRGTGATPIARYSPILPPILRHNPISAAYCALRERGGRRSRGYSIPDRPSNVPSTCVRV